jgi:hypothetical protein
MVGAPRLRELAGRTVDERLRASFAVHLKMPFSASLSLSSLLSFDFFGSSVF